MPSLFSKTIKVTSSLFFLGVLTTQATTTQEDANAASTTDLKENVRPKQRCPYLAASIITTAYEKGQLAGIVLVERGRTPEGYALPGGFIRLNETAEKCAKRTLLDECGILAVSNLDQFKVYSAPRRDPRYHVVDTVFTARVDDIKLYAGTDAKHAFICPIDKIPWDKMTFDHREILKDFLQFKITQNDAIAKTEKNAVTPRALTEREQRDRKELEYKVEPLFLAASVIVEVYEKGIFKGVVLIERGKAPFGLAIPGGHVEYGESVAEAAKREMQEECHLNIKDLRQFKVYSDPVRDPRKRMIDVIHIARVDDIKPVGDSDAAKATIYPLDKLPMDKMAFDHKQILQDYLDYRNGKLTNTLIQCAHNPNIEAQK